MSWARCSSASSVRDRPASASGRIASHRRYECKADHFLALTSIACTLICYRGLAE
ncbi:hypothetical protein [Streptomyces sp. col6]|uniref:hypothetical protein n=1 Tax=Streptomyces sp. col6 TaxID=2478958 RepID=UPI001CD12379|nr:hypothetical protein [Streptomyces sp. col6]